MEAVDWVSLAEVGGEQSSVRLEVVANFLIWEVAGGCAEREVEANWQYWEV